MTKKPRLPPIGKELYEMYPSMSAQTHEGAVKDYARSAVEAAVSTDAEPVAEIVSAHGDPEAFGERELVARADIQKFPYGTKLYAAPPAPSITVKAKLIAELREMAASITYAAEPSRVMREAAAALSAKVQDVADIETYYTTENNWENMFFGPGASTTEMDCIWDFAKQSWANADFKITVTAAPAPLQPEPPVT